MANKEVRKIHIYSCSSCPKFRVLLSITEPKTALFLCSLQQKFIEAEDFGGFPTWCGLEKEVKRLNGFD